MKWFRALKPPGLGHKLFWEDMLCCVAYCAFMGALVGIMLLIG